MNDVALIPYALISGGWNLPDSFLADVFEKMQAEGVLERVFYDGSVTTPEAFVKYMQSPANVSIFFVRDGEPLSFGWLNGIREGRAFAHFCTLKAGRGVTIDMGRIALGYWFSTFDFLAVILGMIAANNKLALRFVRRIGFTAVGEIPRLIYDAYSGQRVAGVLTYCER